MIFVDPGASPSKSLCLEPHDLVVSKLVAGREKDRVFARVLIEAGLVRVETLCERTELLPGVPAIRRRMIAFLKC